MNILPNNLLQTTLREREIINIFWIGFLVYTLGYTISTTTLVNYVICQVFQIIGLMLFLPTFFFIAKFRFENRYLQLVFTLYLIWIAVIVVRGFHLNYEELKFFLFDAWFGGILYLAPLFLMMPLKFFYIKRILNVLIILAVFYVIYDLAFISHIMSSEQDSVLSREMFEYFARTLAVPCFFLLMIYSYQSGKKKFFLIFIFLLTVFFALVRARRGLLYLCGLTVLFSYLLYFIQSRQKLFVIILSIVFGGVLILFGFEIFMANKNGVFSYIIDRGLEDTRTGVELCFYKDMETIDWLIGKGMDGAYFCPGITPDAITGYRTTIETDYLQLILKGGIISLLLFLLITIPAIFKGIFYSKNSLSRAAGIWILLILLNMYPATLYTFTMQFILLWISVGICYSKSFREIPEQVLVDYFKGGGDLRGMAEDIQNQTD